MLYVIMSVHLASILTIFCNNYLEKCPIIQVNRKGLKSSNQLPSLWLFSSNHALKNVFSGWSANMHMCPRVRTVIKRW